MSPTRRSIPTSSDASDGRPQPLDAGLANQSHPGPAQSPSSPGRTWMLVLAAGLFAGLAGFGIGEVAPRFFPVSHEFPPEMRRSSVQMTIELGRRSDVSHDQSAAFGLRRAGDDSGFNPWSCGGPCSAVTGRSDRGRRRGHGPAASRGQG